jgi:hypothetical protein
VVLEDTKVEPIIVKNPTSMQEMNERKLRRIIRGMLLSEGVRNTRQGAEAILDRMIDGSEFDDAIREVFPKYDDYAPHESARQFYDRAADQVFTAWESRVGKVKTGSQEHTELDVIINDIPAYQHRKQ